METTLEKLVIQIQADTRQLKKGLDKVNKELGKTEKKSKKAGGALKKLRGVLAAIGGVAILNQIVQTNRTFEDLEATLRAVTGSAVAAGKSFELIRAFTSQTTFQIDEVASAFITLKQAGIVPTSEVLQDFGNFAAGMGKSITQLAQAAFNATTGEMEMLKQFGVVARVQGDKLRVTFDGTTQTIDRSGDAIVDFLRSIGREKFPTAIEERFNTLSGAISNLKDQVSEFNVSIGDGIGGIGLRSGLISLSKNLGSLLETLRPVGQALGFIIGIIFEAIAAIIELVDNIFILIRALVDFTNYGDIIDAMLSGNIKSFDDFKDVVRGTTGDLDELDQEILNLIKTGGNFQTMFSQSEMTDFKLFENLKKQVISSRRTVEDLIENEMEDLKAIIERTLDLQLKLSVLETLSGDDIIESLRLQGRLSMRGSEANRTPFDTGTETIMLSSTELARRREMLERALFGGVTAEEFLKEVTTVMSEGAEEVAGASDDIIEELSNFIPFSDQLMQTITDAANAFSTDFVNGLRNGEDALESFKDFAGDIVSQIIAIFLQLEVVNRILAGIFPSFQGQVGTGLFKKGSGLSTTPVGSPTGGYAGGGMMQRGMPSIVGERGAELFIPHSGGRLLNNMNTRNAFSGQGVNVYQNINFATGVVPTVRAEVTKMLPQIADVTKEAVQESAMRGGSFRRSLVGG